MFVAYMWPDIAAFIQYRRIHTKLVSVHIFSQVCSNAATRVYSKSHEIYIRFDYVLFYCVYVTNYQFHVFQLTIILRTVSLAMRQPYALQCVSLLVGLILQLPMIFGIFFTRTEAIVCLYYASEVTLDYMGNIDHQPAKQSAKRNHMSWNIRLLRMLLFRLRTEFMMSSYLELTEMSLHGLWMGIRRQSL